MGIIRKYWELTGCYGNKLGIFVHMKAPLKEPQYTFADLLGIIPINKYLSHFPSLALALLRPQPAALSVCAASITHTGTSH